MRELLSIGRLDEGVLISFLILSSTSLGCELQRDLEELIFLQMIVNLYLQNVGRRSAAVRRYGE